MQVLNSLDEYRTCDESLKEYAQHIFYLFDKFDKSELIQPTNNFLDTFLIFLKKEVLDSIF